MPPPKRATFVLNARSAHRSRLHTVQLEGSGPADYRSVVAFFARQLLKELRLVGGYDVLYGKVKAFIRESLFDGPPVDLENPDVAIRGEVLGPIVLVGIQRRDWRAGD